MPLSLHEDVNPFECYRSGNMSVVINQLRRLGEGDPIGESPAEGTQGHPPTTSPMPTVPDFDVDAVCSFLSQPSEVRFLAREGSEPGGDFGKSLGFSKVNLEIYWRK